MLRVKCLDNDERSSYWTSLHQMLQDDRAQSQHFTFGLLIQIHCHCTKILIASAKCFLADHIFDGSVQNYFTPSQL